ncbi:alpha/beta fold hydrolase [Ferrovibrio xuzhouensis]|uniref:Alpha/beta fold hydrolase n=1 Tax=Ferrovibrio xuzhouensis TaxID=1576914 RepID=A0ABV7VH39_9PROT
MPEMLRIPTSHAEIAVQDSGGKGPVVLLIHGNSASSEIFGRQFASPLAQDYRLLALDLPGHGASTDAADPQGSYTVPGYAQMAGEVLAALGIADYALVGWSLGGHIAIEMTALTPAPRALVITGTPPAPKSPDALAMCFKPTPHMALTGQRDFTDAEALAYARAGAGDDVTEGDFIYRAVRRTDGRARQRVIEGFMQGLGVDQKEAVERFSGPLAVINGADEPFVNNDYLSVPVYGNLWRGRPHFIAGSGHAPFYTHADAYNALLGDFLQNAFKG